jgi:hypothetical protein
MSDKSKVRSWGAHCRMSLGGTTMFCRDPGLALARTMSEPAETGMVGTDKPGRGGRQLIKTDVKLSPKIQPSYAHATAILAMFFDGTGTYTPADAPIAKTADVVLHTVVRTTTYAGCWLKALEIAGEEGKGELDWILQLLGTTVAASGTVTAADVPDRMLFSDLALAIAGNTYHLKGFSLKIDYDLADDMFLNSLVRSTVSPRIPFVTLDLDLDVNSDSYADLMAHAGTNDAIGSTQGVVLTFTGGGHSLTITIPEMVVVSPSEEAEVSGPEALKYNVQLKAYLKSGQNDNITLAYA